MAEYIDERGNSDEGQIFVVKSQTGFLPVNHVYHLIKTISGLTSPGLSYLSTTVRRLSRLSPALLCFPTLPLRQQSALCAFQRGLVTYANLLQGVPESGVKALFRAWFFPRTSHYKHSAFLQSDSA